MTSHVALLRGVNVGGRAKVAMDALRGVFAGLGYSDAQTYIQSGNVIFTCPADSSPSALAMERRLAAEFGFPVTVVLRTGDQLAAVVAANPFANVSKVAVTFLAKAPDAERAAALEPPPGEPDECALLGLDVYLYCPSGFGRTKLNNAYLERRLGVAATARNWNTVNKLVELTRS